MSVTDISKITLENIDDYLPNGKEIKKEKRKLKRKEYQSNYFKNVTKPKRKLERSRQ